MRAGRFRQDLYFRLAAATLILPPLRQRKLEVPILARVFLDDACRAAGRAPMEISDEALSGGSPSMSGPATCVSLKNLMEYAAATVEQEVLAPSHLPPSIGDGRERAAGPPPEAAPPAPPVAGRPADGLRPVGDEKSKSLSALRMTQALEAAGGVQARAARLIGMPLRTFMSKMPAARADRAPPSLSRHQWDVGEPSERRVIVSRMR